MLKVLEQRRLDFKSRELRVDRRENIPVKHLGTEWTRN